MNESVRRHELETCAVERELISRLRSELADANTQANEISRKLDLSEREKAEIKAALDSALQSTGWRFLQKVRRLKSRWLPPGSPQRQLYDHLMIRFASSASAANAHITSISAPAAPVAQRVSGGHVHGRQNTQSICCSIIIPAWNRSIFTKACLLSIERSICADRVPYEVIVVDNGSSDDTPAFLTKWSYSQENARFLRNGKNSGFAQACNDAAEIARGRYIVLLNNDTLPTPGWLESMVGLAEREVQAGIIGSKLLFPNGRIQHVGVAFDDRKNPGHIYRGFPANIEAGHVSRPYQAVTGACLLIERKLYWSLGGLDEAFENSYEDIDLCLKVRARGFQVFVCAESTVYHFESVSDNRHPRDFRNSALFKARWADSITPDMKGWYERDGMREDASQFQSEDSYDPAQENWLKSLWRRVYFEAFPEDKIKSVAPA